MNLNHIADGVPACQGIVDAVVPLRHTVADIGCKIAGCFAVMLLNSGYSLLHQSQKMGAARMTVAKGALHHNLWFG